MLKEVDKAINNFDLFISTAAVSDFKPEEYENQKIKKQKKANNLNIDCIFISKGVHREEYNDTSELNKLLTKYEVKANFFQKELTW